MRKDVKNKKIPTKAKTIRNIIEICEFGYGSVYTWGMKQLFPKFTLRKYLKAERLSRFCSEECGRKCNSCVTLDFYDRERDNRW